MTVQKKNLFIYAGVTFFDVIPYEGRYDAQSLAVFKIEGRKNVHVIQQPDLTAIKGQVRDIKWLDNSINGTNMVVARNNEGLIVLKLNKSLDHKVVK